MTGTIVLIGLMTASLVAIAWNLACGWSARRDVRRTHTTVQIIAENGDGDQFPVATMHRVHPWGTPVDLTWTNPSTVPVQIIGWYAAFDWPAGGISGDTTERQEVLLEPGGIVVFQATMGVPSS